MKYITDILVEEITENDKESIGFRYKDSEKEQITSYLRKFKASMFTSAPVIDIFTDMEVAEADNGYTDGEYTWYESEIHYFEHYNMKLNKDFIEHIKKAS